MLQFLLQVCSSAQGPSLLFRLQNGARTSGCSENSLPYLQGRAASSCIGPSHTTATSNDQCRKCCSTTCDHLSLWRIQFSEKMKLTDVSTMEHADFNSNSHFPISVHLLDHVYTSVRGFLGRHQYFGATVWCHVMKSYKAAVLAPTVRPRGLCPKKKKSDFGGQNKGCMCGRADLFVLMFKMWCPWPMAFCQRWAMWAGTVHEPQTGARDLQ